jgi:thiol-disulfide isomerase/thioredoxin
MNKTVISIVIATVLIIGTALAYVFFNSADESQPRESPIASPEASATPAPEKGVAANSQPGEYVAYSEDKLQSTAGTKLLFFHAPWCPQCREIEKSINEGGLPAGVTVLKVDYDSNQALRQKYGVTLQTTFVKIDDAGNKIASYVAYEEPHFSTVERELLK